MRASQFLLVTLALLITLASQSAMIGATAVQDILGGASLIFITHPKNPPVRHKPARAKTQQTSQSNPASAPTSDDEKTRPKDDLSDEVEDALALGNSARDAEPPRYEDAEKAYKLAAKLNPKDPRPYMGLANIWYDQKHFEEAAKKYRQAAQLMASNNAAVVGSFSARSTVRGRSNGATALERGELRAYLGNALLQQGQYTEAEVEFRKAIGEDAANAQSYALLGYALFQQKKYAEASKPLKKAVQLAPENPAYKQLLVESVARQNQP